MTTKTSKKNDAQKPPAAAVDRYAAERTSDGAAVAATAANPSASHAGRTTTHIVPNSDVRPKGELGLNDIEITVIEGRRAKLRLGKAETGLLTQDDLFALQKTLAAVIQGVV